MREDDRRDKLIGLGSERLADALLELADRTDYAEALVVRMTSTQDEIIKRFRGKLAGLKRSRKFVDWRGAQSLAEKLDEMLADLEAAEPDHATGVELVAAFYRCDAFVFEMCDDSSGFVGDVFRFHARRLFVQYAQGCADEAWLAGLLFELYAGDDYGVRERLLEEAHHLLSREKLRELSDHLWEKAAEEEEDSFERCHWTLGIESIARQLKDPALFEKARKAGWSGTSNASCLDIARVYLEAGEAETALAWVRRIDSVEAFRANERDGLLLSICGELGDRDGMTETAWRIFRGHRSEDNLELLLSIIGEEARDGVIVTETRAISASERLSYPDAFFLVQVGRIEEAEAYLLKHEQSLDGYLYEYLKPLAQALEEEDRPIAATVLYRALLDSILARAVTRYYHHGVRYLRKLDRLEGSVGDWKGLQSHDDYKAELLRVHGRKRSFWTKYEGSGKQ